MLKQLLHAINHFDFGDTPQQIEVSRQRFLIRFFAVAGSAFLLPLAIVSFVNQRLLLGTVLIVATALFLLLLRFTSTERHLGFLRCSYSALLSLLVLYLVFSGGAFGTGIYYCFALCMLIICYTGYRLGLVVALLLLTSMTLVFCWQPGWLYPYPTDHDIRIVLGFAANFIMMLIFEWMRVRSYGALSVQAESHKQSSQTDGLTGVLNRDGLLAALRSWQPEQFPAALALIDLDHFKQINDQHGHLAGDQALITFAQLVSCHIKGRDLFGRWGGEEFVLVMANTSLSDLHKVVEDIRRSLQLNPIRQGAQPFTLAFSGGACQLLDPHQLELALAEADEHLYRAKQSGRNRLLSRERPLAADSI